MRWRTLRLTCLKTNPLNPKYSNVQIDFANTSSVPQTFPLGSPTTVGRMVGFRTSRRTAEQRGSPHGIRCWRGLWRVSSLQYKPTCSETTGLTCMEAMDGWTGGFHCPDECIIMQLRAGTLTHRIQYFLPVHSSSSPHWACDLDLRTMELLECTELPLLPRGSKRERRESIRR